MSMHVYESNSLKSRFYKIVNDGSREFPKNWADPARGRDDRAHPEYCECYPGTPKAADLNSPGRRIGTASDESPRMEESADVKRYEQLLKICNQMKDKEAELNQKEEKLRTLNANKLELNRSLAELKDKASKEAPAAKNEHAQQIEQTINDKNTLIQVIEK